MAELVNLTPHPITILNYREEVLAVIEPTGLARCSITRFKERTIYVEEAEIRLNRTKFGEVSGLPDPEKDTFYIVSKPVAEAMKKKRADLLIADEVVRREGKIIGCRSLARIIDN